MRELTVGVVAPAYVNLPLWVAQERGFLERRGLRATEQILGSTHGVSSALRNGLLDVALTAPEGSVADAVAGGPLRVVAALEGPGFRIGYSYAAVRSSTGCRAAPGS